MIFKSPTRNSLVLIIPLITLLSISSANAVSVKLVERDIVKQVSEIMPRCVSIQGVNTPNEYKEFLSGCKGNVVTTVKKRLYNISPVEITSSCSDFNGNEFRTNVSLTGFAKVVVANRKLKSSTILDNSMLGLATAGISNINGNILCKRPTNYSYTLKRNVDSNDILYESYIRQSYAVRRSQLVNVHVGTFSGVDVNTKAKATSNAYINDITNVMNLSSRRTFKVRVVGFNKVEVI